MSDLKLWMAKWAWAFVMFLMAANILLVMINTHQRVAVNEELLERNRLEIEENKAAIDVNTAILRKIEAQLAKETK